MAVHDARHLNNFFREMLSTTASNNNNNPIQIGNNLYSNSNLTNSLSAGAGAGGFPATVNESLLLQFYNLNDVAFHSGAGKLSPAVKDDSGVTFNNSLVPTVSASRKRQREPTVLPAPMIAGGGNLPLLTVNPIATGNSNVSKDSSGFSFLGEDLSLQIMQQQLEVDRLISQHMEKMRIAIEERKKQQLRIIMAAIEEAMAKRLRDKEEEIDKISKINWSLEERVKSLCLESQIWRDLAQTNEATANDLRTNLEQVLQQVTENVEHRPPTDLTDDAVSCCGSSGYGGVEERENEGEDELTWRKRRRGINDGGDGKTWIYRGKNEGNGEKNSKRLCRKCGEGESSVLLLPCRHLCLCTLCGPAVNSCPICNSTKNASVHVNLS